MMTRWQLLRRAWRDDSGQDLVEYALIIAIVVTGTIAVFPQIATKMGNAFTNWGANVETIWIPSCPGTTNPCP
jgi:pilus assembly protein Flp/PilA